MQPTVFDDEETSATRDVGLRNAINQSNWTAKQKARAEGMKWALDLLYTKKAITISYGKNSIRIKLDRAQVKDKANLALLEKDYEQQGVVKKVSANSVTYTIKA